MMIRILGLTILSALAISPASRADTVAAAESTSSSSNLLSTIRKNIRGNYINEFAGPSLRALSGNSSGGGTDLQMIHYLQLGYKIGSKWTVSATQPATQRIDEKPATEVDPFEPNDPYFTVSNSRILGSQRFGTNLYGLIRYYAPLSKGTINEANSIGAKDSGNGRLRFQLIPSKSFLDGALNFTMASYLMVRLAKNPEAWTERAAANRGNPKRENMMFVFDPILGYAFNDTVEGYLEYAVVMRHRVDADNSQWTNYKDEDTLALGANLQLTKQLLLNPWISSAPNLNEVKNSSLGLTAVYAFL